MQHVELQAIAEAVAEIQSQLPSADERDREKFRDSLRSLRDLATTVLDAWMVVDDAIEETYHALVSSESHADESSTASIPSHDVDLATTSVQFGQDTDVENKDADPSISGARTNPFWNGPLHLEEAWYDWSITAHGHLRKGLGFYDLQMYKEAAEALSVAVASEQRPDALIYLALSHMASGELEAADDALQEAKLLAQDVTTVQAILEVETQICAASEDWHRAIHVLYNLLETDAPHGDIWFNLGMCHIHLYEFGAAARCFERAVAYEGTDVEALLWQGLVCAWTNQIDVAKSLIGHVLIEPSASTRVLTLGVLFYLTIGSFENALRVARMPSVDAAAAGVRLNLEALCYVVMGNVQKAIQVCKKAITLDPPGTLSLELLGLCLFVEGDWDRAERVLSTIEGRTRPVSSVVRLITGRLAMKKRDFSRALQLFKSLQQDGKGHFRRLSSLYLGLLYDALGDETNAGQAYQRAKELGLPASVIQKAKAANIVQ